MDEVLRGSRPLEPVNPDRDLRGSKPAEPPETIQLPPRPKASAYLRKPTEEEAAFRTPAEEEAVQHPPIRQTSEGAGSVTGSEASKPPRQTSDGSAGDISLHTPEEEKEANRKRQTRKAICVDIVVALVMIGCFAWLLIKRGNFKGPTCASEEVTVKRPSICEACGSGTFVMPLGGALETSWHPGVRAALYILGVAWCFLGVCIVCDLFMLSIEQITSSVKVEWLETAGGCQVPIASPFWNGSVANLSLIALGSSAPEIILNIIELLQPSKFCLVGELGISTIVGSAAFNLLVITSVCISAIDYEDMRKIDQTDVFFLTATSSIFAYVWMWIVLAVISPDKVDVWEALLTLFFFPILILLTYLADKQMLPISPTKLFTGDPTRSFRRVAIHSLSARHQIIHAFTRAGSGSSTFSFASSGSDLSKDKPSRIPTLGLTRRKIIVSETRSEVVLPVELTVSMDHVVAIAYCTYDDSATQGERYEHVQGLLRFEPGETQKEIRVPLLHQVKCQSKLESFSVELTRPKDPNRRTTTRSTMRMSAMSVRSSLHSRANRNSNISEDVVNSGSYKYPRLGISRTQVLVLKDTEPGFLTFEPPKVVARPTAKEITVNVSRTNGTSGAIACNYRTIDDGAIAGDDFEMSEGVIHFGEGINSATISIPLLDRQTPRAQNSRFYVILEQTEDIVRMSKGRPSVQFSELYDMKIIKKKSEERTLSKSLSKTLGSTSSLRATTAVQIPDDACSCAVVLLANASALRRLWKEMNQKEWWYWWYMYLICWREQIREAFYCGGTADEQEYAIYSDWIFHALSLMWKVMFAFIPPPVTPTLSCITFVACLAAIMGTTVIIKDLAELLGCCAGLAVFGEPIPADVTAITLVALGTSLPDTMASKIAAQEDESADSAIGNVTGSNSVNVFLGLGLPWTIASIYWNVTGKNDQWRSHSFRGRTFDESYGAKYPSGGLIVPADSLASNVSIFIVTAVACLGILAFRRRRYGGELGGPKWAQRRDSFFLMLLWVSYICGAIVMSASVT